MGHQMEFEWDDDKRSHNVKKHLVDFAYVAAMFKGALVETIDDRENYGEERIIALGQVDGNVYRVVYTLRDDRVRIISAMEANKHEKKDYYEQIYDGRN